MSAFRTNDQGLYLWDTTAKKAQEQLPFGIQRINIKELAPRTEVEQKQIPHGGQDRWIEGSVLHPLDIDGFRVGHYGKLDTDNIVKDVYKNNQIYLKTKTILPTFEEIMKSKDNEVSLSEMKIPNIPHIPKWVVMEDQPITNLNNVNFEENQSYMMQDLTTQEAQRDLSAVMPDTVEIRTASKATMQLPQYKYFKTFRPTLGRPITIQDRLQSQFNKQGANFGQLELPKMSQDRINELRRSNANYNYQKNIFNTTFNKSSDPNVSKIQK